jgi:hypothetical protein
MTFFKDKPQRFSTKINIWALRVQVEGVNNRSRRIFGTTFALSLHWTAGTTTPGRTRRRSAKKMKVLGMSVTLFVAISLMLAIIMAQRDYQLNWGAGAVTQTSTTSESGPAVPERIAEVNR